MESKLIYNIYRKDKHTRCSNINFESEEAAWNYLSNIIKLKKLLTDRKSDDNYKERYYIKETVIEECDSKEENKKKEIKKVKFKRKETKPDSLTDSNPHITRTNSTVNSNSIEKETITFSDSEWQGKELMTPEFVGYTLEFFKNKKGRKN